MRVELVDVGSRRGRRVDRRPARLGREPGRMSGDAAGDRCVLRSAVVDVVQLRLQLLPLRNRRMGVRGAGLLGAHAVSDRRADRRRLVRDRRRLLRRHAESPCMYPEDASTTTATCTSSVWHVMTSSDAGTD